MNRSAIRRLRLHSILFTLLLFAFSLPEARAQVGLYGQFNATHFNNDSVPIVNEWGYGGAFGLYGNFFKLPFARVGGDLRFQCNCSGRPAICGTSSVIRY